MNYVTEILIKYNVHIRQWYGTVEFNVPLDTV